MINVLVNVKLTPEHLQMLKNRGQEFKNWIDSEEGKKDEDEKRQHEHYFKEKLSPENISKMTENDFSDHSFVNAFYRP